MEISIIVPTYNRVESLLRLLASIAKQTLPADQFEVLIVDDGSTDGTASTAKKRFPYLVRYYYQPNQGDAAARNLGAEKAKGDLIVFLDDDIILESDFLKNIQREAYVHEHDIIIGTTYPCPDAQVTPFGAIYTQLTTNFQQPVRNNGYVNFTECVSHLMAIRRSHYFSIGKMRRFADDGADIWCDVEFGYRAYQQGIQFRRSTDAIGYHHDGGIRDLHTYCRRMERAARVGAHLFSLYPDLFFHIPMFEDKGYISIRNDLPHIIARKFLRYLISFSPILWILERLTFQIEMLFPKSFLLRPLYRWIVGSYISKGFRQGLCELNTGCVA